MDQNGLRFHLDRVAVYGLSIQCWEAADLGSLLVD